MSAREWLAAQTPVIEGWKAEDAAFESYCKNRDMGIKAEALMRFYTFAAEFERRYRDEKLLREYESKAEEK